MFTIECTKKIHLSEEDIDDIMSDAMDYCGYWCDRAEVVGDYLGDYASEQISRGGEIIFYEAEENGKTILNLAKFLHGFKRAVEDGYFSGNLNFDGSDYDGSIADVILQLALFDEVVYG